MRRVQRRMQFIGLDASRITCSACAGDPNEVELLFHDLLIGVTTFFRDPETFDALAQTVIAASVRRQGRRQRGARLGAGLRHRRGSLFARHPAARIHGEPAGHAHGADLRHRHRRGGDRRCPQRPLSRLAAEGRFAGAAGAVLHRRRRHLPGAQGSARSVHVLGAQRDPRSAVLAHRPGVLPQPADLPRHRPAGARHPGVPLRAGARLAICCSAARKW